MPAPTSKYLVSVAFVGVCAFVGTSLVMKMLIHFRDSTIIKEPSAKTQYISQKTEDSLAPSTLDKLINSTTYSIREIAARIVCDRALHDESTIEALLWYITRPDLEQREKGLRALFMLATKSGMSRLNQPRVFSALVTSLSLCVRDVRHDKYDREYDNWDFRDVNEKLCLTIAHRLITTCGVSNLVKAGFVPRWLAKERWGKSEQERQENFKHCYHQTSLLSYIILQVLGDPLGTKQLERAKLIGASRFQDQRDGRMTDGENSAGIICPASCLASVPTLTMDGIPLHTLAMDRSPEEQRMRRNHRDAMVLHDGSEPLGADSIITRDAESSSHMADMDELRMEADRHLRTQGLLAALTPRRLENMRAILRSESDRMEQQGLEEEPSVGILRDILENEINNRLGGSVEGHSGENDVGGETEAEEDEFDEFAWDATARSIV